MPRYNVNYDNKWACFSTITDSFITIFYNEDDFEKWRKETYGLGYVPLEESNIVNIDEVVVNIRNNRSHDEAINVIMESGISRDEAELLIGKCEDKWYRPKLIDDVYRCPNCGILVDKGQSRCVSDLCGQEFIWD